MGVTELIPGVSSATIAIILGIYERFITALNGLTSSAWRTHLPFLIPLGIGVGASLVVFSRVIEWLLLTYPQPTLFFFLGLILGVIPFLLKTVQFRSTFRPNHYVLLIIAALLVASTRLIREDELAVIMTNLTATEYVLLFVSGWLASSFMILPGISGALVFLLLGVYPTVVNALYTFNLPVILVVGSGVVVGVLITSKLIRYLFNRFSIGTYAAMIGLITGSTIVIFPGEPWSIPIILISMLTFLGGVFVAVSFGRVRHN